MALPFIPLRPVKTTCHLPFFFLDLGSLPSKASFRQDARGHNPEKEKPTTPEKAYYIQPQINLFIQKPTTPPLLVRQSKQVTIQVTETNHHVADLKECYRTTCSPCSLSCTLACWSRSRYLFSPQCLLASSA